MDPLRSFENRLLSGNLIDTSEIKSKRPAWLESQRVPAVYRDLEALVAQPRPAGSSVPAGVAAAVAARPLDTARVYQLLVASGLPQSVLARIWDQCSRTTPGLLVQAEFYQALALVAICQGGHPPNPALLLTLAQAPIPQLAITGYPFPLATTAVVGSGQTSMAEQASPVVVAGQPTDVAAVVQGHSAWATGSDTLRGSTVLGSNTSNSGSSSSYGNGSINAPCFSGSTFLQNGETITPVLADDQDCLHAGAAKMCSAAARMPITSQSNSAGPYITLDAQREQTKKQQQQQQEECILDRRGDSEDDEFGDFADFRSAPLEDSQLVVPSSETCRKTNISVVLPLFENCYTKDTADLGSSTPNGKPSATQDLFFSLNCESEQMNSLGQSKVVRMSSRSEPDEEVLKKRRGPVEPATNKGSVPQPKATINGAPIKLPAVTPKTTTSQFSSALPSLFDSLTVQTAETVQPPSEPNPWLHFSLKQSDQMTQAQSRKRVDTTEKHATEKGDNLSQEAAATVESCQEMLASEKSCAENDFDEFAEFQSAPAGDSSENRTLPHDDAKLVPTVKPDLCTSLEDRYSVFRQLEPDRSNCNKEDDLQRSNVTLVANEIEKFQNCDTESNAASSETSPKVDILELIKLPTVPTIDLDDELNLLDSLAGLNVVETKASALEELQDLDLGYSVVDGPVATDSPMNSPQTSPTKSVASGGSIGESRGERPMSLFNGKANYSECASLSSFELGPNTESNGSSPTKGSILSLELNSPKKTPPDDTVEEDETLEWSVESTAEQLGEVSLSGDLDRAPSIAAKSKSPDEFCWAQPPTFPPPDPTTDSSKPSSGLQDLTGIHLHNYPGAQSEGKKRLTKVEVAESWARVLSKVSAILETASHILGNDRAVVAEILTTAKGQGYVSSLLEVYNVSQQIKKAASLFSVEGVSQHLEQVESAWRRKLDDLTVSLGLSVICLDHLSSSWQSSAETCAICLLPLLLRPQLVFGDQAYHATCANFWANVLAEGLPCLKLD